MPIQNRARFEESNRERAGRHTPEEEAFSAARADLEHSHIQLRAPSDPLEVALSLTERRDTSGQHRREK